MASLLLYGKESCHLCDEAEALLRGIAIAVEYVDISPSTVLTERYGRRIPVLVCTDSGAELDWQFDAAAVMRFLGRCHSGPSGV